MKQVIRELKAEYKRLTKGAALVEKLLVKAGAGLGTTRRRKKTVRKAARKAKAKAAAPKAAKAPARLAAAVEHASKVSASGNGKAAAAAQESKKERAARLQKLARRTSASAGDGGSE